MGDPVIDLLVVGHGLAGAAVAWAARWRGWSVGVVDAGTPNTASRVAAGLMTPLSGKRFAKTWEWDAAWRTASAFYRRVEAEIGEPVLFETGSVWLYRTAAEFAAARARAEAQLPGSLSPMPPPAGVDAIAWPCAARLRPGGRLAVEAYLRASQRVWQTEGRYAQGEWNAEWLVPHELGFAIEPLGWTARRVVFCQGWAGRLNPFSPGLPFLPSQGEILEVATPGWSTADVIHAHGWLAPATAGHHKFGATYAWTPLDGLPRDEGRQQLEQQMRSWYPLPFETVAVTAAVRPGTTNQRPVVGWLDEGRQMAVLNGLGSKGSLWAPWLAERLLKDHSGGGTESPIGLYKPQRVPRCD